MLGKIEDRRRKGQERMRWLDDINGHEFEEAPGDGEGQGSLVCCSPWGHKELDTTERLNSNNSDMYSLWDKAFKQLLYPNYAFFF